MEHAPTNNLGMGDGCQRLGSRASLRCHSRLWRLGACKQAQGRKI